MPTHGNGWAFSRSPHSETARIVTPHRVVSDISLALVRRAAFDALGGDAGAWGLDDPAAFCGRLRAAGVRVLVDTRVRLWRIGPHRYGWEDAGDGDRPRVADYTFYPTPTATVATVVARVEDVPHPDPHPVA